MSQSYPTHGSFSVGKKTANAGTAIAVLVPPDNQPLSSSGTPVLPALLPNFIHVTDLVYDVGTTAHTLTVMRPLNYTTFSADAAASQQVVNLTEDPGLFQTAGRYKYALPNGLTVPSAANNGVAQNDFVAYQAASGQWVVDTVSSVSGLAVTLATNLPTGGVKKGGLLYFFGLSTDVDPATNLAHQQIDVLAAGSGTSRYAIQASAAGAGLFQTYHAGDPLVIHSSNGTTAGTFQLVAGYYSKF